MADRRARRITLASLVLAAFVVFRVSPVRMLADSFYSTLLSYSVLTTGSVHLERFLGDATAMRHLPGFVPEFGRPYQVEPGGEHLLYWYPPAPSLLAVPLVGAAAAFGLAPVDGHGRYDPQRDNALHAWLAPVVAAAIVGVLFETAALLLPLQAATVMTVFAALGTPIWSTLSRAMSSNTWHVLLLAGVVLELVAAACSERPVRAALVAMLLAWAYLSRPATSVVIACVTAWMLLRQPARFGVYAVTGALWAAVFFAYSLVQFGTVLPSYYRLAARMRLEYVAPSALGMLFSPSRGVLVYSPVVLWVGWLACRYRRTIRFPDLAALAVAALAGTFAAMSTWRVWWGGYSYGPRLGSDFIPWLFLLAVLGLDARRRALAAAASNGSSMAVAAAASAASVAAAESAESPAAGESVARAPRAGAPRGPRRLELAVGVVLALASVAVNAPGALQTATLFWNERLGAESGEPPLLWDWAHPQFLAAWRMPPFTAPRPPRD